jgi:hypothetical protein
MLAGMMTLARRLCGAVADWWSFQLGTIAVWLDRRPESDVDRQIRERGERLRRAFPNAYAHERDD